MLNIKGKIFFVGSLYQKRESGFFKWAEQAGIKHTSPLSLLNVVICQRKNPTKTNTIKKPHKKQHTTRWPRNPDEITSTTLSQVWSLTLPYTNQCSKPDRRYFFKTTHLYSLIGNARINVKNWDQECRQRYMRGLPKKILISYISKKTLHKNPFLGKQCKATR